MVKIVFGIRFWRRRIAGNMEQRGTCGLRDDKQHPGIIMIWKSLNPFGDNHVVENEITCLLVSEQSSFEN